jgi:cytochrome c-type biogenesis protein
VSQLLTSSSVLAAFFGGVVALLAPCCVSVMLPAYFASGFQRRSRILGMTFVFAAGVATIILPIALGASALSRLLLSNHTPVFVVGGALMIAAGLAMTLGWTMKLPMLASAPKPGRSLGSVYALGAFSGAASACCAPVLAGVAALAGVATSFGTAVVIGVAYVFGMVAPLAVLALVWDKRDWGSSRLFRPGAVTLRVGSLRRQVSVANLLAGGLLTAMGLLTVVLAFQGRGMSNDGWQIRVAADIQHYATRVLDALSWLPGWAGTALVLVTLAALAWAAVRTGRQQEDAGTAGAPGNEPELGLPASEREDSACGSARCADGPAAGTAVRDSRTTAPATPLPSRETSDL